MTEQYKMSLNSIKILRTAREMRKQKYLVTWQQLQTKCLIHILKNSHCTLQKPNYMNIRVKTKFLSILKRSQPRNHLSISATKPCCHCMNKQFKCRIFCYAALS